jgi:type VI secretion system protein ImpE
MNAKELFQAGKLGEAVQALGAELRSDPTDFRRRTFLFELLCFSGEYDRAEKQLDVLADASSGAGMGSLVYRSALHAERTRQAMFLGKTFPKSSEAEIGAPVPGTLNGNAYDSIEDADPRIGARLEVFAAGAYLWLPFAHIASVEILAPKRLRDLMWATAVVKTAPGCKGLDMGEVLLPVLTPFAYQHPDNLVRLGRKTDWVVEDGEDLPAGQKMFLVDGEEVPFLEVRSLVFGSSGAAAG